MRRSTEEEPALRPRMAVAGEIPWPLTTIQPAAWLFRRALGFVFAQVVVHQAHDRSAFAHR